MACVDTSTVQYSYSTVTVQLQYSYSTVTVQLQYSYNNKRRLFLEKMEEEERLLTFCASVYVLIVWVGSFDSQYRWRSLLS